MLSLQLFQLNGSGLLLKRGKDSTSETFHPHKMNS